MIIMKMIKKFTAFPALTAQVATVEDSGFWDGARWVGKQEDPVKA